MNISGNDLYTVSGSDIGVETPVEPEVTPIVETPIMSPSVDLTGIEERIDTCIYLLTALLFFTIFTWIDVRLRNSIRRMFKRHE